MPRGNLVRGLVAGVAGGLLAAFVMDEFQKAWNAAAKAKGAGDDSRAKPATLKAADKVSKAVSGRIVPEQAQKAAASGVHYLTGAALGGLYGVTAEFGPAITMGAGAPFGAAVWLILDEALTPALGLAPPAHDVAPADHVYALTSHLIFGAALEAARTGFSRLLSWKPIAG